MKIFIYLLPPKGCYNFLVIFQKTDAKITKISEYSYEYPTLPNSWYTNPGIEQIQINFQLSLLAQFLLLGI